jgi:hypothetical protein
MLQIVPSMRLRLRRMLLLQLSVIWQFLGATVRARLCVAPPIL